MTQQFLCEKHRHKILKNPSQAIQTWSRLHYMGGQCLDLSQWNKALKFYGSAMETADLLLSIDADKTTAVDRYLRAALSYAYSLRKHSASQDVNSVYMATKKRLEVLGPLSQPVDTLLAPLLSIVSASLSDVDQWMQVLLAVDQAKTQQMH